MRDYLNKIFGFHLYSSRLSQGGELQEDDLECVERLICLLFHGSSGLPTGALHAIWPLY